MSVIKNFLNIILLIGVIALTGCSTFSKTKNSGYRWAMIGAAVPTGAAIGAATAPEGNKPANLAMFWGAAFGFGAALIGELFFSDKNEIDGLKANVNNLEAQVTDLKVPPKILDLGQGSVVLKHSGGKKEDVRVYSSDQVIELSPNEYGHIDAIYEKLEKKN